MSSSPAGYLKDVERQDRSPHPLRTSAQASQRFSNEYASVGAARRFVAATLADSVSELAANVELVDDACLIVSELVTNAVKTAAGDVDVVVQFDTGRLRIEVADHGAGVPAPKRTSAGSASGRGLQIVAAVAQAWGYESTDDGKRVWADLDVQQDRPRPAHGRARGSRVT